MNANGDNIDSADWSLLAACFSVVNGHRKPGRIAPLSVSHTVITKPNVMENQLDGCLLLKQNNKGVILCVFLYSTCAIMY